MCPDSVQCSLTHHARLVARTGNRICDAGAASLGPALRQLTGLTALYVSCEYIMRRVFRVLLVVGKMRFFFPNGSGNRMTDAGNATLLKALLQSRGQQRMQGRVMWELVTPTSLKLAGLPQTLAMSWDAFLANVAEVSSTAGMCTDGVHASVVLVGHEGAGKTTLAARLATGVFRDDTTPTVGLATCESLLRCAVATCTLLCVCCPRHSPPPRYGVSQPPRCGNRRPV